MKKLVVILSSCLMGLSTQAVYDWRVEPDPKRGAWEYFHEKPEKITREDIRDAVIMFSDFFEWPYFRDINASIAHLIARFGTDPRVLTYLLGFSPDLTLTDTNNHTPENVCASQAFKDVFAEYRRNPWRHPDTVFDLSINHDQYMYDHKRFGGKEDLIGWEDGFSEDR